MLEAILRIVHIFAGVWVVGYYFFMVPVVLPQVMKLAPPARQPVTKAFARILTPVMWTSLLILVATGIVWTFIVGGGVSELLTTGWGWAMIIGLVLTIVLIAVSAAFLDPVIRRVDKLEHSIQGRAPTSEEAQQLEQLTRKIPPLLGLNFALALIIFIDMLIARYL